MAENAADLPILGDAHDLTAVPGDPALRDAGWQRRTMTDPSRVEELTEIYTSLGFEVLAQPLSKSDFGESCEACAESACTSYVLMYTRRGGD